MVDVVVGRQDRDARRLQAHLEVFAGGAGQLAQLQERWARRGDEDARRAGLQLGHALFPERAQHLHVSGIDARDARGLRSVEREEGDGLAVLLERDGKCCQQPVGGGGRDVERAGLSDEAIRLVDGQLRRRSAAGDDIGARAGKNENDQKGEEPAHGLHHTSLVKYEVRDGEWRYRLGVRTRGSQPRDRGSIPRTATITHSDSRVIFLLVTASQPVAGAFSFSGGDADSSIRVGSFALVAVTVAAFERRSVFALVLIARAVAAVVVVVAVAIASRAGGIETIAMTRVVSTGIDAVTIAGARGPPRRSASRRRRAVGIRPADSRCRRDSRRASRRSVIATPAVSASIGRYRNSLVIVMGQPLLQVERCRRGATSDRPGLISRETSFFLLDCPQNRSVRLR